jgi:hypothetical protein
MYGGFVPSFSEWGYDTLSKHEKEFCEFLKNVKVPSGYSMNVSRFISFPDLKVSPGLKSCDYHVLLT